MVRKTGLVKFLHKAMRYNYLHVESFLAERVLSGDEDKKVEEKEGVSEDEGKISKEVSDPE